MGEKTSEINVGEKKNEGLENLEMKSFEANKNFTSKSKQREKIEKM